MKNHKHIIVNATVNMPPTDPEIVEDWLTRVVKAVNMNILIPAKAEYSEVPGAEGVTGIIVLDTSHCSIHVWHTAKQPYLRADLYSCKDFDDGTFIKMVAEFGLVDYDYIVVDRNKTYLEVVGVAVT